jgi:hypothetical protein
VRGGEGEGRVLLVCAPVLPVCAEGAGRHSGRAEPVLVCRWCPGARPSLRVAERAAHGGAGRCRFS